MKTSNKQSRKIRPIAPPRELCGKDFCLPNDCADLGLFEWALPPAVEETFCAAFNVTREQFYQIVDEPAARAKCEADFQRDYTKITERIDREWGGAR